MTTNPILQVDSLTKSIQNKLILYDVHLKIYRGEICTLIGNNGAGKSLFLNCILGYEPFESGTVLIDGYDIQNRHQLRKNTAFVPSEGYEFCELLTPNEFFSFLISIYSLPKNESLEKIQVYARYLNIDTQLDELISNLSFGTKKKVLPAKATLEDIFFDRHEHHLAVM
jgi:ABC-2 type transport system ATP-binding protein